MHRFAQTAFLSIFFGTFLFSSYSGAASMNGQTILGAPQDPRIQQCGLRISGDDFADLAPFIQAAADFNGSFDLNIGKTSDAGTSQTRQSNRIKAGTIGASRIRLDLPARIAIEMNIRDDAGKMVCRLSETIDLPVNKTKL